MADSNPTNQSPDIPIDLPEGVTLEDAERITKLADEDRRPSTRRVYRARVSVEVEPLRLLYEGRSADRRPRRSASISACTGGIV